MIIYLFNLLILTRLLGKKYINLVTLIPYKYTQLFFSYITMEAEVETDSWTTRLLEQIW